VSVSQITVTGLAVAPVKAMRLLDVDAVMLDEYGARGDRAFYVVDERGRMVNGKQFAQLLRVVPDYDPDGGALALTFPGGDRVAGQVEYGEPVTAQFYRRTDEAPALRGPWSEALSSFLGAPLRLVAAGTAATKRSGVDRGRKGGASIVSRASLARLAEVAERDSVDVRRFRMLIEIGGVAAHAEDRWVGRRLRVGDAVLKVHGHVGRCLITTRDPQSAESDLPTLDLLRSYRGEEEGTEPLPFGIYGEVLEGGPVRVGDALTLDG
jgi:uncharacterized protein YcbX